MTVKDQKYITTGTALRIIEFASAFIICRTSLLILTLLSLPLNMHLIALTMTVGYTIHAIILATVGKTAYHRIADFLYNAQLYLSERISFIPAPSKERSSLFDNCVQHVEWTTSRQVEAAFFMLLVVALCASFVIPVYYPAFFLLLPLALPLLYLAIGQEILLFVASIGLMLAIHSEQTLFGYIAKAFSNVVGKIFV